ncbi:MAG: hypothetical protein R3D85_16450 [Paracoccaceae bacterium]|nr:hypothetical protein [Paracoccaceae bacterium]MCB2132367.1 hypothetical protein [Paracoccaceae bacterium]MCB2138080.1 hypothetical protein [Paracoccaceae bacterium]MCB2159954.1 hypothetical protein [Paracoccaceae bacterium]
MIDARPYSDQAAMAVFRQLDLYDFLEAEAIRGEAVNHLSLFGDWRAMRQAWAASWVVHTGPTALDAPFALVALTHTGQRGVAGAAMLARDHERFRRPLVQLARLIRDRMPEFCNELGIARIEARAWARHPRASAFLQLTGFAHECDMPGFGPHGNETFRQFAWTASDPDPRCLAPTPEE